jgi:hypothetical protein
VGSLLWLLFAWSAWAQSSTVVADTTGEGAALASVRLVVVVPSTVVAGTTIEGAALAYDCLVGESSARHCGGGHEI